MAELKTQRNDGDVREFLASVENPVRREDALVLLDMFEEITGEPGAMWGDAIVGFGATPLTYASGRQLDWPVVGFSPRKQAMTLYLTFGFDDFAELLGRLGKHTISKSCLYIKKLSDVDQSVLRELIAKAWQA